MSLSVGATARMTSKVISIENIVSRILHETPPLRDRFTSDELNQQIRKSLDAVGIHLELRVCRQRRFRRNNIPDSQTTVKGPGRTNTSVSSSPTTLFPATIFLSIYFPDEEKYKFSRIAFMAIASMLIALLLISTLNKHLHCHLPPEKALRDQG